MMELASKIAAWIAFGFMCLYLFGIVAGLIAIFVDWLRKEPELPEECVRHAAEQYRIYFGTEALSVIGEHTMAASFAPDGRHKRFLRRVTTELMREEGIIEGEPSKHVQSQLDG